MSIIARNTGGAEFAPLAEGVYVAVCTRLIDLGMQHSEKYDKTCRRIALGWEVPGEKIEVDGSMVGRVLHKEYTTSLHEKSTLRKDLQAWRGRAFTEEELLGFDMKNILGKGCQIQIIHSRGEGRVYANIAAIMALPKGTKVEAEGETICFDLEDESTFGGFAGLPRFLQDRIREAKDFESSGLAEYLKDFDAEIGMDEDELPF